MSKDPAFLFYPGDYLRDTQCMSAEQQVAYDRMICEHMRNICISKTMLNFFTKKLNEEDKQYLIELLKKVNGGYQIEWVALSIEKRRAYSESRRKNKEGTHDTHMLSCDTHMENENEDENKSKKRKKQIFKKPTKEEVCNYFEEKGYNRDVGARAWGGYDAADWHDSQGTKIINWKQKMWNNWFRPEHEIKKHNSNWVPPDERPV